MANSNISEESDNNPDDLQNELLDLQHNELTHLEGEFENYEVLYPIGS